MLEDKLISFILLNLHYKVKAETTVIFRGIQYYKTYAIFRIIKPPDYKTADHVVVLIPIFWSHMDFSDIYTPQLIL